MILLSHPHVLFDHLYLFFDGFDLNVVNLVVELAFFVFFKLNHLALGHLALNLVNHLNVEFTL